MIDIFMQGLFILLIIAFAVGILMLLTILAKVWYTVMFNK